MDCKAIICVTTFKTQQRIVGIDVERISSGSATDQRVIADAVRNPAARSFCCDDPIGAAAERAANRWGRPENLPDQEGIIALSAIQSHDCTVVIGNEKVAARLAGDQQSAVDIGVVADPLHRCRTRCGVRQLLFWCAMQ